VNIWSKWYSILITVTTAAMMGTTLTFDVVCAELKEAFQFDIAQANRKHEEAKAMVAKFEHHKQQQQQQKQLPKKKRWASCSYTGHTKEECRKPGGDMEGILLPEG
jgi:hypothetical protein